MVKGLTRPPRTFSKKYSYRAPVGVMRGAQVRPRSLKHSVMFEGSGINSPSAAIQTAVDASNNTVLTVDTNSCVELSRTSTMGTNMIDILRQKNAVIQDSLSKSNVNATIIRPSVSIVGVAIKAINTASYVGMPVVVYTPSRGADLLQVVSFSDRCYLKLGALNVGANDAVYSSWPTTFMIGNVQHCKVTVYYNVIATGNVA